MITFSEMVAFAGESHPALRVNRAASAFLSLSGFSALIVTAASSKSPHHQVAFSQGYTDDCVEHVRSSFVCGSPYYEQVKKQERPVGWHSGFSQGFEATTWLRPAGFRNGSSICLQDDAGAEIGSIHTNTRREVLSDRQFDALDALKLYLVKTLQAKTSIEQLGLSEREMQVIRYLVEGATNPEIAEALFLSRSTVATHVENILRKLDAHSRVEIAVTALRLGLV